MEAKEAENRGEWNETYREGGRWRRVMRGDLEQRGGDGQRRWNRGVLEQTERGEEGVRSEGSGKRRERETQKGTELRGGGTVN